MKKIFLLIVLILVSVGYYYLTTRNSRTIIIGVECDHAPYNWEENSATDTNSPLVNCPGFFAEGYDVQIAKLVAEKIGAKPVFKKIEWENLIDSLIHREIDAIFSGMVDTDERKLLIAFTQPYETKKVEYAVLINRSSKYLDAGSIQELTGARMIAQKDSRFDEVIEQIPNVVHLKPLETQSEIIDELMKFHADGTVLNYDTGESYERTHSRDFALIRFSEDKGFGLGFTGLCAGVRKTDKNLLDEINEALESISMRERQRIMDRTISKLWKNL